MALYGNHKYEYESKSKIIRNTVGKIVLFGIMSVIAFFISIHLFSEKSKVIIRADLEIEKVKLENAIKNYKARAGTYPELSGNENSLNNIKSPDGKYSFDYFYNGEKLFIVPGNLEAGIEDSNKVISRRDKSGGWVYNRLTGEVNPNID